MALVLLKVIMHTEYIYVLELNDNHYYVGKTRDIARRFNEHKMQKGCAWTKLHGGCKIIEIYENHSLFDEDKYTLECMNNFGVDNTRGGSYSNPILSVEQRNNITRALRNANNLCMKCGDPNHYSDVCSQNSDSECARKSANDNEDTVLNVPHIKYLSPLGVVHDKLYENKCERCGRNSHKTTKCFAKSDIHGKIL